jgi:hypothetical protein
MRTDVDDRRARAGCAAERSSELSRASLRALIWQTATTSPAKLWILAVMLALAVAIEGTYRLAKRGLRLDA